MRKIGLADHLTDEELAERMDAAEDKEQYRRWQALYIIKTRGYSSEEVAGIIRVSSGTVLQWVHLYNNNGEEALILKGRAHYVKNGIRDFTQRQSARSACQGIGRKKLYHYRPLFIYFSHCSIILQSLPYPHDFFF